MTSGSWKYSAIAPPWPPGAGAVRGEPLLPEVRHERVGHGGVSKFKGCCIACWIYLVLPHTDTSDLRISQAS